MLHIGFDVRLITDKMSGIGGYAYNLYRHLRESANLQVTFFDDDYFGGSDFCRIPSRGRRKIAYMIWLNAKFPRILREAGVEVLHSPNFVPPFWGKIPAVVTFHDVGYLRYPHTHQGIYAAVFPSFANAAAEKAKIIIAPSESTRREILHFYPRVKSKVRVIYEGANENFRVIEDNTELNHLREKYRLPERFILCVGTLEPRKNLERFIAAYRIWIEKNPGQKVKLILCGKSWVRHKSFLDFLQNSGVKDKIVLTGYVPSEEIAGIYNLAEALGFPSYYEGFGLPAVEAMNCGLPVIASNVYSLPEVLGEAAAYFDPFSTDEMVKALDLVLKNAEERQRLRELGLQRAKLFSWKKAAEMTEQVYFEAADT